MSSETTEISPVEGDGERGGQSPDQVRREIEEQFNVQRAKMKDLFLQKEVDLQRMQTEKEQLESEVLGLRAEVQQLQILSGNQLSEIQNLQLLVSETVEVSSSGSEELRRLKARNNDLEQLVSQLRHHISQQEVSLAPATFVRSLARKLGGDTEVEQPSPRKNVEDGELMQSIIQPMDMEITALKNKLRETDAQLQEVLKAKAITPAVSNVGDSKSETESTAGTGTTSTQPTRQCDMCVNYEKQLVAEQSSADAARERANKLDQALRLATEELEGVRSLHDETVRSWHGDRALSSAQLEALQGAVRAAREELGAKAREAEASAARALECVTTLTVERETLQKKLDTLERDNAVLMGQYTKKAAEMQNEVIDLPDNVAELQLHTLQLREQLIECAIGRELALDTETELRAQLLEHGALFHRREDELRQAREALRDAREQLDRLQTEREQMKELGDKLRHSSDMIEQLLEDKKRLQAEVYELRSRVSVLQQELDNSEMVQQDFVRLSQSLQVQLQRIREANTEVRWQHEEDVTQCPSCHTPLPHTKKKVHCRHCGRIFCSSCVSHAVPCGPRRVPARVCSVCHTLLQPDTAPYFSTDPPTSPH